MPKRAPGEIEVWCHRHWAMGADTTLRADGVNMFAANEFLLRRFITDTQKEEWFDRMLKEGAGATQLLQRALANNAPLCCFYGDDSTRDLFNACRRSKIEQYHPEMNVVERELIIQGRLQAALEKGPRTDN